MMAQQHLALADVKNRLSEGVEETLEILSDRQLMDEIREGQADIAARRVEVLTRDEILAQVEPE